MRSVPFSLILVALAALATALPTTPPAAESRELAGSSLTTSPLRPDSLTQSVSISARLSSLDADGGFFGDGS
ncbi:hypothetical protein BC834DRAFT_629844 [Gloeopeniophorella convolvens]|nr:hypothetical protein BC834DRAFT_629844 [Gloeopeniophorella convolvens]